MDLVGHIRLIWDYNYWAHHQLLSCLQSVSKAQFERLIDYGIGSLHQQVVHTMWAEALWLARIRGQARVNWTISDYPTLASVIQQWQTIERDYRSYLNQITQPELERNIEVFSASRNETYPHPVYEILLHVVNHGTDHRSQMLRLIGEFGGNTFEHDMIYYFRAQSGQ